MLIRWRGRFGRVRLHVHQTALRYAREAELILHSQKRLLLLALLNLCIWGPLLSPTSSLPRPTCEKCGLAGNRDPLEMCRPRSSPAGCDVSPQ